MHIFSLWSKGIMFFIDVSHYCRESIFRIPWLLIAVYFLRLTFEFLLYSWKSHKASLSKLYKYFIIAVTARNRIYHLRVFERPFYLSISRFGKCWWNLFYCPGRFAMFTGNVQCRSYMTTESVITCICHSIGLSMRATAIVAKDRWKK